MNLALFFRDVIELNMILPGAFMNVNPDERNNLPCLGRKVSDLVKSAMHSPHFCFYHKIG